MLSVQTEDGVTELKTVLSYEGDRDAQLLLHLPDGHVIQKHVFMIAEHIVRQQQALTQIPALQRTDQILTGDETGDNNLLAEESIRHGNDLPLNAVGSIAFFYRDQLCEAAAKRGYAVGKILRSPLG